MSAQKGAMIGLLVDPVIAVGVNSLSAALNVTDAVIYCLPVSLMTLFRASR